MLCLVQCLGHGHVLGAAGLGAKFGTTHGHEHPASDNTPALHSQAIGLRLMCIKLSSVLMPLLFDTAGLVVGVRKRSMPCMNISELL